MAHPKPVVVMATAKHTATLIFLHGLGDTGHGWAAGLAEIRSPHVKIVCPTAKRNPVTLNSGFPMPSWFDIKSLDVNNEEDDQELIACSQYVHSLIEEERKIGIESNRIVLGGFSQGGAVALYSALTSTTPLAGILALSSWVPRHKSFPKASKGINNDKPILQCHGQSDPVVNYVFGNQSSALLKSFCTKHTFKTYPQMGHTSNPQEMNDVKMWLNQVLPPI